MSSRMRKTLPADFAEQLKTRPLDELKAIFDSTELTACSRTGKACALAFPDCPDELTRWLVDQGLDVDTPDAGGWTPLATRAGYAGANLAVLLELGAAIDGLGPGRGNPLVHAAAMSNLDHIRFLIEHGADPLAVSCLGPGGHNALEVAVGNCDRFRIEQALPVVEYLTGLARPSDEPRGWRRFFSSSQRTPLYPVTDVIRSSVRKHGRSLEKYRFALATGRPSEADTADLQRFDAGVHRLYELFDVPPVPAIPPVAQHDGTARIEVTSSDIDAQFTQLWTMLVPPSGPAPTVQGEVIRIVGRLRREIEGNGGINWDEDFRTMQEALSQHLASGNPVPSDLLNAVREVIAASADGGGWDADFDVLDEAAVAWVQANPEPVPLPAPSYRR